MKPLKNINLNKTFKKIFYYIVSIFLFIFLCSYDGCDVSDPVASPSGQGCGGGGYVPPPPNFDITYSKMGNGNTKFYFSPNEKIILQSIQVEQNFIKVDVIDFKYPFLLCEAGNSHIINEYNNIQSGDAWKFIFSGTSLTTSLAFNTSDTVLISF